MIHQNNQQTTTDYHSKLKNLDKEFSLVEIELITEYALFTNSEIKFGKTNGLENVIIENHFSNVFIRVTNVGSQRQILVSKIHFCKFDSVWTSKINEVKKFLYSV